MRQKAGIVFFISLLLILFFSCRKTQVYSIIPEIEYKSFDLRDTTDLLGNKGLVGQVSFSFVDGDGDIGLKQPVDDTDPEDTTYYNMFFTLWAMVKGELIKPELEQPLNYRIPYLEPESQDPSLKGIIKVDFLYIAFPYDTISYDFYIKDRAGHESNVVSTPFFILPEIKN